MKHADLIIAAAQGKPVQRRSIIDSTWHTYQDQSLAIRSMLDNNDQAEYRLAPEPVVTWQRLYTRDGEPGVQVGVAVHVSRESAATNSYAVALLKLTHDPSTGEITAEVEKV